MEHIMNDASRDTFDLMNEWEELGRLEAIAYQLVEAYPFQTSLELLDIGVELGVYPNNSVNKIRPRLTELRKRGQIRRVEKVIREGRSTPEYTYAVVLYPKSFNVKEFGKAPVPLWPFEHKSHSDPKVIHTTIYWDNNEITCSCPGDKYHSRCRERIGMRLMVDGTISPGDFEYIRKIMKEGPAKTSVPDSVKENSIEAFSESLDDWDPDEAINNLE